jgi:hypothetical protein
MSRLSGSVVLCYFDYLQQLGSRITLQRRLLGIFSFLILAALFSSSPVAALVDGEPGLQRPAASSLDNCQSKFAEALRLGDREREYRAEKARYAEAVSRKCSAEKWYDLDLLECILFVPVFGLFLPFFGLLFIGALGSMRRSSSLARFRKGAESGDPP